MLVNFRFKNCRSFYDESVLSMQATPDGAYRELNTFNAGEMLPKGERELIKSAAIFGGNASGKSNVLKAFYYMANVVRLSSAHAQFPIVAANESFAFKVGSDEEESLYEVEIIQNGKFYKYGFELCKGKVKSEWLYRREVRKTPIFERKNDELKITGESAQSINLIKIPDATLFLSIGNNFNLAVNVYLNDVMQWFMKTLVVFENSSNSLDIYDAKSGKYKEQALEILKRADIGITDFNVIKDKLASTNPESIMNLNDSIKNNPTLLAGQLKAEKEGLYNIDLKTAFDIYDDEDEIVGQKDVMLFKDSGFNSEGTARLLCYLGWILAALDQGRVIFIDEIDSRLHFLVVDYIVKLFNSIENNPRNAQLICTAHNVMLMDDGLRRDQIYFTSKDSRGRSTLVSLADYTGVRKNDLFSKRYLAGFYADLPNMITDRK